MKPPMFRKNVVLDQRGEIRCSKTCSHVTCANKLPFSLIYIDMVRMRNHKVSHTLKLINQQIDKKY